MATHTFGQIGDHNPTRMSARIPKFIFKLLVWIAVLLAASSVLWWTGFLSTYAWLLGKVTDVTGLDVAKGNVIALTIFAATLLLPGWVFLAPWRYRRHLIGLIVVSFALVACLNWLTQDVFFSRSGPSRRYYIRTLEGFRFSASQDTDPIFGLRYKPVTPQVVIEYRLWLHNGNKPLITENLCLQAFNTEDGESQCWYLKLANGRWAFSLLPGYHPIVGIKMMPVTPEIVQEYESSKAKDEEKVRREAERQRQKQTEETEKRKVLASLENSEEFKRIVVIPDREDPSSQPGDSSDAAQSSNQVLKKGTVLLGELRLPQTGASLNDIKIEDKNDILAYAVQRSTGLRPGARLIIVVPSEVKIGDGIVFRAGSTVDAVFTARIVQTANPVVIATRVDGLWIRSKRGIRRRFPAHAISDGTLFQNGSLLRLVLDDDLGN